jgi:Zn-dependent protease
MSAKKVRKGYTIVGPQEPVGYGTGYDLYTVPRHRLTSPIEIRDMLVAIGILTVAFSFVFFRGISLVDLSFAFVIVVAGFFTHEMAHKMVARRYGCWAEFRADFRMLGLALLMSMFEFLFAAPGAVMIAGRITNEQNGKISIAGPASNMLVAAAFLPFWVLEMEGVPDFAMTLAHGLTFICGFLAFFNLLPIPAFDGLKVWAWNKPLYIASLLAAGLLVYSAWAF